MAASSPVSAPRIVSWGELLWDVYPTEARLGGASANLAFHAARLGCQSLLVSRVGRDELGARALDALRGGGVDVSGVATDDDVATGQVQVSMVAGEPHFSIGAPAAWDHIRCPPSLAARIRAADALCFGTLAQRTPLVRGELLALLQELADEGPGPVRVVDLNLRAPFVEAGFVVAALEHAQVVKLNESELAMLRELDGLPTELRHDPLAWLTARRNVRVVAVTRAERGALLLSDGLRIDHPGHPSPGVDPVGAGDAFTAVLARELCRGTPLPLIADRACRYAAWVASQPGAQPAPPPELVAALEC